MKFSRFLRLFAAVRLCGRTFNILAHLFTFVNKFFNFFYKFFSLVYSVFDVLFPAAVSCSLVILPPLSYLCQAFFLFFLKLFLHSDLRLFFTPCYLVAVTVYCYSLLSMQRTAAWTVFTGLAAAPRNTLVT